MKFKKPIWIASWALLFLMCSCKEQKRMRQEQEALQQVRDSLQQCLDSIRYQKRESPYNYDMPLCEPYPIFDR